ncbi:MAG: protein kinase domain-containing protein [Isosphaeraceae bacterium]
MDAISVLKADVEAVRRACSELRNGLRAGEPLRVEDLLNTYPALAGTDEAVLELIHVEILTRKELGQKPTVDEWQERFPRLLPRMEQMLSLRSVFGAEMPTLTDPTTVSANPLASAQGPDGRLPRIGNYQILQEIGRGGMGVVYKARQTNLSRIVAVKMILAGEHAGLRERARLRIEAEAAAQLVHPNVVQIFEIGEHDGLPFLAMEYVPGGNLTRMLRGKPQAFRWSARLTETLARAIHEAHERGIVHRDLNPSNILIAQDGTPKISDFGLAKFLIDDHGLSLNGVMLGTPSYMSPEQVSPNGRAVGPPSDVYALGALLYEMLTGAAPFRGFTPMETLCQVVEAELVPPSRLRHGVPEDLETICLKCLDRDPSRRYASAADLADDLRRYNESQPIRARRTSTFHKVMQWRLRQPLAAKLLAISLLLFVLLLGFASAYSVILTQKNLELQKQYERQEKISFDQQRDKERFEGQARRARRQSYDVCLNQIKQCLDGGQVELARELFRELEADRDPNETRGFEWGYLDGLLRWTSHTLAGHEESVMCLSLSPRGGTMLSGDRKGKIIAWDLVRRTQRFLEGRHEYPVEKVAIDCDPEDRPRSFASVSQRPDRSLDLTIWSPENNAPVASLRTAPFLGDLRSGETTLRFAPDGELLTLCGVSARAPAGEILAWKREAGRWRPDPLAAGKGITRQAFSTDGTLLAEGRSDGTIRLLGLKGRRPVALEQKPGGAVLALAFSRDGKRLAAGREDHSLTVWDMAAGKVLEHWPDEDGPIRFLGFCLDGETLVGCEGDSVLWTQRLSRPSLRRLLPGTRIPLHSVTLSPDGRMLAAGGWNSPVTVWDLALGSQERSYLSHNRFVREFAFAPNGRSLILGCEDPEIRIWNFRDPAESTGILKGHQGEARTLAFSPEGRFLASGGDDHLIRFWDLRNEKECLTLSGHDQTVTSIAFFPGGKRLASVSMDGRLIIWDLEKRGEDSSPTLCRKTVLHHYAGQDRNCLRSVAVSSDGKHLAVGGSRRPIDVWDARSNQVQHRLVGHDGAVQALLYSPNPSVLVSASSDRTVRFWEARSESQTDIKQLDGRLRTLAFSETGLQLATAGEDRVVTIFSMDSWKQETVLQGHPLTVRSVAFCADRRTLASACDDAKVRLWDLDTHQLVYTLQGHRDRVNAVAFSPDGQVLASCDHKGVIRLWRARDMEVSRPLVK